MKKIQELKEKGDPESLQLLTDDPLVGIPIDYRFDYPKLLDLNMHLEITQWAVPCGNSYTFLYSINILTKRNNRWLVSHLCYFSESWQGNLDY